MSIFYLDSSAWVKYYVSESGSQWIERFWSLRPPCACSDLGLVEILATLARRQKEKPVVGGAYEQIIHEVRLQFLAFQAVPLSAEVLATASEMARKRALRGADCVHLASAIHIRRVTTSRAVTFIASDMELLGAASAEGFPTLDPTEDPVLPEIL
jgi:predicted nucleic acid-binding protein